MDYATTLIQIMERQYHSLLVRYGMNRLSMPGTIIESRKRGEFFRGPLQIPIKALKALGGDLYIFNGNRPPQKTTVTKANTRSAPVTEQIPLRQSPRFTVNKDVVDLLQEDDGPTKRAVERLAKVQPAPTRRSARLAGQELVFEVPGRALDALARGDRRARRAMQALGKVRRSPRLAGRVS